MSSTENKNTLKQSIMQRFLLDGKGSGAEQKQLAKDLLGEISVYFTDAYGDLWLEIIKSETTRKSWMLNLIGVSKEEAANAVAELCNERIVVYPPNPILFRSYCKKTSQQSNGQSQLRIIR
jgi:hypothetical protein